MSDQAALALSAAEFAREMAALGPFSQPPRLAIACSGGADSLALTLLAADWVAAQGGSLVALTVDHGLRADSGLEARRVGAWLGQRGIAHAVLRWDGAKPKANLAAAARVLTIAFTCFAFGWIGGGEARLAAATALWFGLD